MKFFWNGKSKRVVVPVISSFPQPSKDSKTLFRCLALFILRLNINFSLLLVLFISLSVHSLNQKIGLAFVRVCDMMLADDHVLAAQDSLCSLMIETDLFPKLSHTHVRYLAWQFVVTSFLVSFLCMLLRLGLLIGLACLHCSGPHAMSLCSNSRAL